MDSADSEWTSRGIRTDSVDSACIHGGLCTHGVPADYRCFIADSTDSKRTPCRLHMDYVDSSWTPDSTDSVRTPRRLCTLHTDSIRTPRGLSTDYVDSSWTPNTRWTPRGLNGFRLDSTDSRELRAESTWTLCGLLWTFAEVHELCKNKKMLRGVFTLADSALILQKKSVESTPDSARVKTPHSGFFFFLKGLRNPVDIHKSQHRLCTVLAESAWSLSVL